MCSSIGFWSSKCCMWLPKMITMSYDGLLSLRYHLSQCLIKQRRKWGFFSIFIQKKIKIQIQTFKKYFLKTDRKPHKTNKTKKIHPMEKFWFDLLLLLRLFLVTIYSTIPLHDSKNFKQQRNVIFIWICLRLSALLTIITKDLYSR